MSSPVLAMPSGRGMSDEEWMTKLSSCAVTFASFYVLLVTYRKQSYIKIGVTSAEMIKKRSWVLTDKHGSLLDFRVLFAFFDSIPRFGHIKGVTVLEQTANLENCMKHVLGKAVSCIYDRSTQKYETQCHPSSECFKGGLEAAMMAPPWGLET